MSENKIGEQYVLLLKPIPIQFSEASPKADICLLRKNSSGSSNGPDITRSSFCGRISRVDTANGTTDKKRTVDGRMELHPGFDGISELLYKHGLEA